MRALHAPLNVLVANSAYMVMTPYLEPESLVRAAVAGSPRWAAQHNEQRRRLLTMDFRTFFQAFIKIPCQVVKGARQVRWRGPGLEPLARRLLPPPRRPLASKPSSTNEPLWPHLAPACPKTGSSAPKTTKDRSLASARALQHRQLLPTSARAPRAPPLLPDDHRQLENACFRTKSPRTVSRSRVARVQGVTVTFSPYGTSSSHVLPGVRVMVAPLLLSMKPPGSSNGRSQCP